VAHGQADAAGHGQQLVDRVYHGYGVHEPKPVQLGLHLAADDGGQLLLHGLLGHSRVHDVGEAAFHEVIQVADARVPALL
jgi:hypothetical protein